MRLTLLAIVPLSAMLAACQPVIPQAPSASVGGVWEATTISGSRGVPDDIIKINVATGAAWIHSSGADNGNYFPIKDGTPAPPPGDYHLIAWSQLTPNGDVHWNAYRFDRRTGHTWVAANNNGSYFWSDIATTIASQ